MQPDPKQETPRGQDRAFRRPRATGDGPWFWCSQDAADYAIQVGGANGLLVYVALCRRQSMAGGRPEFYASAANLAAASGLSARAVKSYVALLVKARLVATRSGRHAGTNGAHAANLYRLPSPLVHAVHKPCAFETRRDCPQIEPSLQSKEEGSGADAPPAPTARGARAEEEEEKPTQRVERPWL